MSRRVKHPPTKTPHVHDPRPGILVAFWRGVAIACAVAGFVLTLAQVFTTPVLPVNAGSYINAPDEAAHIGYVRVLIDTGRLPRPSDRDETYEWHQPPLYYAMAAPWEAIGPRAARLFSALLALLALIPIYRAARLLFPNDPAVPALAVGLTALLPMREAISGAVSNDPLTELLFSCAVLLFLRTVRSGLSAGRALEIGVVLAAAILTKLTAVLLVPVFLIAAFLARKRPPGLAPSARNVAVALIIVVAATGWWFARNRSIYGEWAPMRAFTAEFSGTQKAVDWIGTHRAADLWTGSVVRSEQPMTRTGYWLLLTNWTFRTFIGAYTPPPLAGEGIPLFLPPAMYLLYLLIAVAALVGIVRGLAHHWRGMDGPRRQGVALLAVTFLLVAGSFAAFASTWFQAQGRYLYPAMLPLSVLGAYGLRSAAPSRFRDRATLGLLGLLFVLAAAFYFVAIQPAYT